MIKNIKDRLKEIKERQEKEKQEQLPKPPTTVECFKPTVKPKKKLSNEELKKIAETHKPPQEWYSSTSEMEVLNPPEKVKKKSVPEKSKLPSPKQIQNELDQKIQKFHKINPPSLFRLPVGSEFTLKYQEDLTWLGVLKVPGEEPFTINCIAGEWALRILGKQWYLKQKEKENV